MNNPIRNIKYYSFNVFIKTIILVCCSALTLVCKSQTMGYEFPFPIERMDKSDFVSAWKIIETNDKERDSFTCIYIKKGDTILLVYPERYLSLDVEERSYLADFETKELTILRQVEIEMAKETDVDNEVNFLSLDTVISMAQNSADTFNEEGISNISYTKDSVNNIPVQFLFDYKESKEIAIQEDIENTVTTVEYIRTGFSREQIKVEESLKQWWPLTIDEKVNPAMGNGWQIVKF